MKLKLILVIVLALMTNFLFGQVKSDIESDIVIGKKIQFESKVLNEKRTVLIHYPDTVIDKSKRYPVLYCVDGEFRFYPTFGIVDYHSRFKQVPSMIVVSIENIDKNSRMRDMTPPNFDKIDSLPISIKTNAERFLDFIEFEVMPYINKIYNPLDYKVLAGHSLGGLFSGYCFFTRKELFDSYIASDPSFWYRDGTILKLASWKNRWNNNSDKTFYFTISKSENKHKESLKLFKKMINNVNPEGLRWKVDSINRDHGSAFIDGMSKGLLFVYEDWKSLEKFK